MGGPRSGAAVADRRGRWLKNGSALVATEMMLPPPGGAVLLAWRRRERAVKRGRGPSDDFPDGLDSRDGLEVIVEGEHDGSQTAGAGGNDDVGERQRRTLAVQGP